MRITVTLTRQLGCGGSYLGQVLADHLHIRCLDREIVSQAAQHLAVHEDDIAGREERGASFWERMLRGVTAGPPEALYHSPTVLSVSDRDVFEAETEVMKKIAEAEDCVFVGRAAAHVLPVHSGKIDIMLHAPLKFRVRRLVETGQAADPAQARALVAQADETRRRFITQMCKCNMDDAQQYHLCLDTSSLPLPDIAEILTDFVQRKIS